MNALDIRIEIIANALPATNSFFARPQVQIEELPFGSGIPLGIEYVYSSELGIGGAYGAWGDSYDNENLPEFVEDCLGGPLPQEYKLRLAELGFVARHHLPKLTPAEHIELEIQVGARLLRAAAYANGWDPCEVDAVLIGMSVPVTDDYVERIASEAGIPENAIKVSIHKACDSSVAGLHIALNPDLATNQQLGANLAEQLYGKKVLVGGIEGLSRVCRTNGRDVQALQLFGTAAGVIGVIPGQTMKFLVGDVDEVFDEEGLLQVCMAYPHSHERIPGQSLVEVAETGEHSIRVAGLMHVPAPEAGPVAMTGMGITKFFVRNGVPPVKRVYKAYRELMAQQGTPGKDITVGIAHHANLKINQLKAKTLWNDGICIQMPWLLNEFGNVSAASNMIAFLRALPNLTSGDHVLFDGFGAGTYYDVLAVELGMN
jgi:hypothetical protein